MTTEASSVASPLSPRQVTLIRQTIVRVLPRTTEFANLFYDRLFDVAPSVRPLFLGDTAAQGKKLLDTLDVFTSDLTNVDVLRPAMKRLGARHESYGTRPEHYGVVESVLLWTFERMLGEAFTPEVREAWQAAYTLLATEMQRGD